MSNIRGLDELNQFFDQLPKKFQENVAADALRAGMQPIKQAAHDNVNSISGEVAAGLEVDTHREGSKVVAVLTVRGKHFFVAPWLEFGTASHAIVAKLRKGLFFGGQFYERVIHPGSRPRPFMLPALDAQGVNAVAAVRAYIAARFSSKQSFETAQSSPREAE